MGNNSSNLSASTTNELSDAILPPGITLPIKLIARILLSRSELPFNVLTLATISKSMSEVLTCKVSLLNPNYNNGSDILKPIPSSPRWFGPSQGTFHTYSEDTDFTVITTLELGPETLQKFDPERQKFIVNDLQKFFSHAKFRELRKVLLKNMHIDSEVAECFEGINVYFVEFNNCKIYGINSLAKFSCTILYLSTVISSSQKFILHSNTRVLKIELQDKYANCPSNLNAGNKPYVVDIYGEKLENLNATYYRLNPKSPYLELTPIFKHGSPSPLKTVTWYASKEHGALRIRAIE